MNFSSTGLRSWEMTGSLCKHTAPCRTQGDCEFAVLIFWTLEETFRTAAFNLPDPEVICHSGRQAYLQQAAAIFFKYPQCNGERTLREVVSNTYGDGGGDYSYNVVLTLYVKGRTYCVYKM